jgi:hypothetical protein
MGISGESQRDSQTNVGVRVASTMLTYLFGRILSLARLRAADDLDFHAGD